MREKAERSGVVLRPHVKTHKTVEAARLQLGSEYGPITVSTLAEAEHFASAGFRDITYAVPIAPGKLGRVAALQRDLEALHVLVDHPDAVRAMDQFGQANGVSFSTYIKVDCGYHRAGIDPESSLAVELAGMIHTSKHVALAGLLTHAGHSYHATTRDEIERIAVQEADAVSTLKSRLEESGIEPGIRSVGSTPTAAVVERFDGTDEIRPGNYVFYDVFQASIGVCRIEDCAASVLATVISVHPERRSVLIDAGALALSKDRGATHIDDAGPGYGLVVRDDDRVSADLRLTTLSQEHGQIEASSESAAARIEVGEKVRILVNHSCLTAAMYERYHVVRGNEVVGEWYPAKGW